MVTNDLGACEWFVWDLRRSSLIDRGQLDQVVGEFLKRNPRAEAPALAEYLVQQNILTGFQADRILNGKTQGLVLGPYVLIDSIGQGSMGQVYKSTSKNDNNLYAVKVLPRRSMWNVRLARRQVRSFSQFNHSAVVPFVDVGTAGGLHYLVWPLVEGRSLDSVVDETGKLSVAHSAHIGSQVAQGLMVAHQNNIFHGLVKPSNLLVGSDNQTRILDFGIGSLLVENEGESLVDTMSTANTLTSGLDCASPESILEPTNRTPAGDQYSLGCVLYYCLTGRVPFPEGSAVEKMMAHQSKEPTPIKELAPDVPDALVEVVVRLMAKKPEDRFPAVDDVVEALEPFLGEMAGIALVTSEAAMAGSSGGRTGYSAGRAAVRTAVSGNLGGSSGRMNGLGSLPSLPGSGAGPAALGGGRPVQRAAFMDGMGGAMPVTTPAPVKTSMPMFPTRMNFGALRDEIPVPTLSPAALPAARASKIPDAPPPSNPTKSSIPNGWVPMTDEDNRSMLGTVGVIAATMLLMVLVFFGAKLLMK